VHGSIHNLILELLLKNGTSQNSPHIEHDASQQHVLDEGVRERRYRLLALATRIPSISATFIVPMPVLLSTFALPPIAAH
jgi:hypothetical protein